MSKMIILIGPPGCGKSTWTKKFLNTNSGYVVVSSDDIIEEKCKENNKTYSEGFSEYIGYATHEFKRRLKDSIQSGKNIIVDRTNMNAKTRKYYFQLISEYGIEYVVDAVYFSILDKELRQRLHTRAVNTGKNIPMHIVESIISNFQTPTKSEGFTNITKISS